MVLFSLRLAALEISFYGPCSDTPLLSTKTIISSKSVGHVTMATLEKYGVEFLGSENHLQSAFGTPYGLEAIEVISDTQMRSHGWCFDVNGTTSHLYPGDIIVKNSDKIEWYYCYVPYDSGTWSTYHFRTYELNSSKFCKIR